MKRTDRGFEIYVNAMSKSTGDKTEKIVPLVRASLESCKGDILDLGAGGGDLDWVLLSFAQEFDVGLTLLDMDSRMIEILKKRFADYPRVKVVSANVLNFKLNRSFSTAICSSLLHEIFSEKGSVADVKKALRNIRHHLLSQGNLIIRDGVKPALSQKKILLKPLKSEILEKLEKFTDSYQYLKELPSLVILEGQTFVCLSRGSAYEFAVKYQYPEINWPTEMAEQFGFWSEKEARQVLEENGFEVIYLKKYLLDYFEEMFKKDFEFFECKNSEITKIDYFDTHLVIAAKRPGK